MFSLNANWYLIFGLLSFKGDNSILIGVVLQYIQFV